MTDAAETGWIDDMSHQYEHDMANAVYRKTEDHVKVYPCGYSGSNAMPQPDVLVCEPQQNHAMEIKGPIQSERHYIDAEEFEQLLACEAPTTAVYLVVKFSRREPVVVRYWRSFDDPTAGGLPADYNDLSPVEQFVELFPAAFEPRVTDGGALGLDKPDTDDWPSASAGADDVDAICSGLGLTTDRSITAYR